MGARSRRGVSFLVFFTIGTLCGCGGNQSTFHGTTSTTIRPLGSHPLWTFFVSTEGSDTNPGTFMEPFATLARAQEAVRSVSGGMQGDIVVYLRGGVYSLASTWTLDQRDSGMNGFQIIWAGYPGENVAISGGQQISNWVAAGNGKWTAHTMLDNFRQLYVNGTRAVRGRSGPLSSPALFGDLESITGIAGFLTSDSPMVAWKNPQDVELGFYMGWTHMICGVQDIAPANAGVSITMKQPCFYLIRHKVGQQAEFPAYVENALELTTSPGQFYLDRPNHTVYYIPLSGDNMKTADIVAPALQTLMSVTGTIDEPVANVAFTNITFEHSSWLGTSSEAGYPEIQAAFQLDVSTMQTLPSDQVTNVNGEFEKTPGAVVLTYAHNITFERCIFTHMGGSGLDLQLGSQNNTILGGHFYDISANAIQVGDVQADDHHPSDPRMILRGNSVVDSYLHNIGAEYTGSVAIFVGYTDGTLIAHNEITEAPYSGISVGWGWGTVDRAFTTPTPSRNNIVEFNDVHDVMQQRDDGGGVYTLGSMPGTVIGSNLIYDNPHPSGGIYLDEGSRGILVTKDVVFGLYGGSPLFLHLSRFDEVTCFILGDLWNDPTAATILAGQAGLEPGYQDLLGP
jgi:hypothetical protein